jgi:hypothetical protein
MLPIDYSSKYSTNFNDLPISRTSFGHDLPNRQARMPQEKSGRTTTSIRKEVARHALFKSGGFVGTAPRRSFECPCDQCQGYATDDPGEPYLDDL